MTVTVKIDLDSSSEAQNADLGLQLEDEDDVWTEVHPSEADINNRYLINFAVRIPCSTKENIDLGTVTQPIDFFQLFFTEDLMQHIIRETNKYASDFLNSPEIRAWVQNHGH